MNKKTVVLGMILVMTLSGCSTLRRITNRNDETILSGQREEILDIEQQTAKDPNVMGEQVQQ